MIHAIHTCIPLIEYFCTYICRDRNTLENEGDKNVKDVELPKDYQEGPWQLNPATLSGNLTWDKCPPLRGLKWLIEVPWRIKKELRHISISSVY